LLIDGIAESAPHARWTIRGIRQSNQKISNHLISTFSLRTPPFHLTYCTNIHAADGWEAVFANIRRYGPALKARFSPAAPFGLGLRLSAREARELLDGDRLERFRAYLDDAGLYVALINGFPYGPFHGTPVKANVYAPDWRDDARVAYTLDVVAILGKLLPEGLDGGVSTAPLSYKPWMASAGAEPWEAITRNVVRVADALVRLRDRTGATIHLDIEPEPDCSLENSDETIDFFDRRLFGPGATALALSLGTSAAAARDRLREHVRLCFDCCHFAVEYEDPAIALQRLAAAGIGIGRIQLSSALKIVFPPDREQAAAMAAALQPFADATYLHQVVEQRPRCALAHFPDLDRALAQHDAGETGEWRVHFHVPLFAREYEAFASTQDYVRTVLGLAKASGVTQHLEIETYTWDVLPGALKVDLLESIAREYDWVLGVLSETADHR
jgi:sugar phosphate isomerase/epimerase